ncbi:MAG TPA: ABC transporter permease [Gemmatimonadales bacterium]|nr:ABC transporter permease [Gemmatimonadales bacterium]
MATISQFAFLTYQLTVRDLKTRYRQTFLGALWALGRPLGELVVYVIVFGSFLKAPSGDIPYPLFAYTGVVLWTYVAGGLPRGTRSITAHAALVSRTPFPKATIPLAALAAAMVDAMVAGLLLAVLLIAYRTALPSFAALWLLPVAVVLVMIVTGLTLICSALNVFYHDFSHLVDVGVRLWLLITPVVYASSAVPTHYRALYDLNPLVAVFEGARTALFGGRPPALASLLYPFGAGTVLLVVGVLLFRVTEPFFPESV